MFQSFMQRLRSFLSGRYGYDELGRMLFLLAVVLMLVGWLGGRFLTPYLSLATVLAYVPLAWGIFRIYSRNYEKRSAENAAYLRFLGRLKDRDHRYFRCPGCRQLVRVPRKKGKINITCPKCGRQFIRKT